MQTIFRVNQEDNMGEIIKMNSSEITPVDGNQNELIQITEGLLFDARSTELLPSNTISMPIAELSTLGAGVSSLLPALRTVTTTTTMDVAGLFRVANQESGDVLKMAKNGNAWGAMKTAAGGSKMVQLAESGPLTATSEVVAAVNPATMMMAVALFSIEQKLGDIEEMQKQILQHMEFEKESSVEGDVEQLMSIITKYKHNWDNDKFVASNYKMVNDIQRTARAHMISYQKEVNTLLDSKKFVLSQAQVNSKMSELLKKFKYYRLSLYTFALSSLLEIMLSGNFKEEYITGIKEEIEKCTETYRDLFGKCSIYLEKLSVSSLDTNLLKGAGNVIKFTGKIIGAIPVVEKGPVDEFLQDSGNKLKKNALGIEHKVVRSFAEISNPGTGVFTAKMADMVKIYNHTSEICFDEKNIYLVETE
jgi:hypothetical protein